VSANGNPGFLWMPRDWLSSSFVCSLTRHDRSVYLDLLCHSWLDDGIPSDIRYLARMLGVPEKKFIMAWGVLSLRFEKGADGKLRNPKQEAERAKQAALMARRSDAGARGNAVRWADRIASQTDRKRMSPCDPIGIARAGVSPAPAPSPALNPPTPLRGKRAKRAVVELPTVEELIAAHPGLNTPAFRSALDTWMQYRVEIRHPYKSAIGIKQAVKELDGWGPQRAVAAIEHTMAKGWQGIQEPAANGHQPRTRSTPGTLPYKPEND
jgi:hypothetical protein